MSRRCNRTQASIQPPADLESPFCFRFGFCDPMNLAWLNTQCPPFHGHHGLRSADHFTCLVVGFGGKNKSLRHYLVGEKKKKRCSRCNQSHLNHQVVMKSGGAGVDGTSFSSSAICFDFDLHTILQWKMRETIEEGGGVVSWLLGRRVRCTLEAVKHSPIIRIPRVAF